MDLLKRKKLVDMGTNLLSRKQSHWYYSIGFIK